MEICEPDMSLATNNWVIQNPKWNDENAPKWKCTEENHWHVIFGSDYFLRMTKNNSRVAFRHYCKDEHFYYLYWDSLIHDVIFASYDINELIRFVKKLATTEQWLKGIFAVDAVTKKHYMFVTDEFPDGHPRYAHENFDKISLGKHEFRK